MSVYQRKQELNLCRPKTEIRAKIGQIRADGPGPASRQSDPRRGCVSLANSASLARSSQAQETRGRCQVTKGTHTHIPHRHTISAGGAARGVIGKECSCELDKQAFPVLWAQTFADESNELAGVTLSAPDQAWVADFTYIRLRSAFVYLACLLDAFSRRCVSWHLSREMTTQLTRHALHQAIVERQPKPGLIHHSDRGVQYASREYREQLQKIEARIRMSARGNPYNNAKAESFFKTLK